MALVPWVQRALARTLSPFPRNAEYVPETSSHVFVGSDVELGALIRMMELTEPDDILAVDPLTMRGYRLVPPQTSEYPLRRRFGMRWEKEGNHS